MFRLTARRNVVIASIGVLLSIVSIRGSAAADEFNNPQSAVFDISCDLDGDGSLESAFVISTFLNETRTSRDLASNSVFQLVAGVGTILVNGEIVFTREFRERPGRGLNTVSCEATTSFTDPLGNEVVITVTEAEIMIAPPRSPQ